MSKRLPIPPLRLLVGKDSREKLAWIAYIAVFLGLGAVLIIVSYKSAQTRSIGWEHISGGLYRRIDCDAKRFIYREAGGFGNVEIETVEMDEEQISRFCGDVDE